MSDIEKYSFSKLNSYHTCPYAWYLKYCERETGISSAFSDYGSYVHTILERYANGLYEIWELPDAYKAEFEEALTQPFPPSEYCDMKDLYYKQGLDFFEKFQ